VRDILREPQEGFAANHLSGFMPSRDVPTFVRTCDCSQAVDNLRAGTQFSVQRSQKRNDLLSKWRQLMHGHATPAALGDQSSQMKPANVFADRLDVGSAGRGDLRQ
jgi:hypothetical protein